MLAGPPEEATKDHPAPPQAPCVATPHVTSVCTLFERGLAYVRACGVVEEGNRDNTAFSLYRIPKAGGGVVDNITNICTGSIHP